MLNQLAQPEVPSEMVERARKSDGRIIHVSYGEKQLVEFYPT